MTWLIKYNKTQLKKSNLFENRLKRQTPLQLAPLNNNKIYKTDFMKTFGAKSNGFFRNISHWRTESQKFERKKTIIDLTSKERDPYF